MMDWGTLSGIMIIIILVLFLGIWIWAWQPERKKSFDEAAQLALDDPQIPDHPASSNQQAEKAK